MNRRRGFTLLELLVAVAIFAVVAAIAYAGLSQVAQTRQALQAEQERFAALSRALNDVARDLRQAVARPVRGHYGERVPALLGSAESLELSRLGFANPHVESRSNVERVIYALADRTLRRGRFVVLDRAPGSVPVQQDLLDRVVRLRWRYLDRQGRWSDQWPRSDVAPASSQPQALPREQDLPRAVELTLELEDFGELRRVVALPAAMPLAAPAGTGPTAPVDDSGTAPSPGMNFFPQPIGPGT